MEALYLLVPLSVMLVALAVWIFVKAADSGQFEDLEGPGMRILSDDDRVGGIDGEGGSPPAVKPPTLHKTPT